MHQPNPIDIAAKASGEPAFREVGVGPWGQTHPGEPRPDDPQSPNYDRRFDTVLLDEGDRRNVLDRYRYWTVSAIKDDLDDHGRHDFEVAVENWTHDFNIGSMQGRADDGTVPARRKPPVHSRACRMLEAAHCRRNRRSPIASGRNRIPHARKCKKSELCLHERGGFVS